MSRHLIILIGILLITLLFSGCEDRPFQVESTGDVTLEHAPVKLLGPSEVEESIVAYTWEGEERVSDVRVNFTAICEGMSDLRFDPAEVLSESTPPGECETTLSGTIDFSSDLVIYASTTTSMDSVIVPVHRYPQFQLYADTVTLVERYGEFPELLVDDLGRPITDESISLTSSVPVTFSVTALVETNSSGKFLVIYDHHNNAGTYQVFMAMTDYPDQVQATLTVVVPDTLQ